MILTLGVRRRTDQNSEVVTDTVELRDCKIFAGKYIIYAGGFEVQTAINLSKSKKKKLRIHESPYTYR